MGTHVSARRPVLPAPRGPLSDHVISALRSPVHAIEDHPAVADGALVGDDLHLALYLCYELHYTQIEGVDPGWEWEPSLLGFRRQLEDRFEKGLMAALPEVHPDQDIASSLVQMAHEDDGPSLSGYLLQEPSLERFLEVVIHRSAYQLKEADPHSWVLPRLSGPPKAALVEVQMDEYGNGEFAGMHAVLFQDTMEALGLETTYGHYLERLPGITLAGVNLMSMFGLHLRWRGAAVGHLAIFEMTSTEPNRRYGDALRRLGFDGSATRFYDVHVQADAVHEAIAAHDLAAALGEQEPELRADIFLGAAALLHLENLWAAHLLDSWAEGRSSLLPAP